MQSYRSRRRNIRQISLLTAIQAASRVVQGAQKALATDPACKAVVNEGGPATARLFANTLLYGPERRFFELFRMTKSEFKALIKWLKLYSTVKVTQYQSVEQKVMIYLWIVAFNEPQRNAAHFFKVSQSTVSTVVKELTPCFVLLHQAFVQQPIEGEVSREVATDPRTIHFAGAIGAIDGTHIQAKVPAKDQTIWRNRKGRISQNVLAAVRFDGSFTYVLAGGEGSMHDARLLNFAFQRGLKIPRDRYYLADAGFNMQPGIMIPFHSTRYHLQDWVRSANPPQTKEELYNLRHSRLRIIVEQAFGWLKRRSKWIRETAPEYSIERQIDIVYAVTGLYNFIISQRVRSSISDEESILARAKERADQICGGRSPREIRYMVAEQTWQSYQQYIDESTE